MEKQEHINYWQQLAAEDMDTALYNVAGKRHVPALFFFHLCIEKLLKANWVKDNFSNTPPFTHDLQKISSETSLLPDADKYDYLSIINTWNIEARYPDYKRSLYQIADEQYLQAHTEKIKHLYEWLLSQL